MQYVSGHEIEQATIWDKDTPDAVTTLTLTEADMPVRAVITARGQGASRRSTIAPEALFQMDIGNDAVQREIRFRASDDDTSGSRTNLRTIAPVNLGHLAPGESPLWVSVTHLRNVEMDRLDATFRGAGRPFSVPTIALGALLFTAGPLLFRRQRRA